MDDPPEIHPEQQVIHQDGPYLPGSVGFCYWCSELATYSNLDIGLPKKPGQPKTKVSVCALHYATVIAPALARVEQEKRRSPWMTTRS